jgi:D-amino acid aminotransferase
MLVWLNGRLLDVRRARLSPLDRGLLHGDGVYDTWRTYGGRPFALDAHLRRLAAAARRLELPRPEGRAAWAARTRMLLRRNHLSDGALRLTITRGEADGTPAPRRTGRPTVLLTARPLPAELEALQAHGVAAVLLPFGRDTAPGWGDLKLVGHPSAVLGKLMARRRRAFEGLYVTPARTVTEGTTSNVFAVERGTLLTPPADGAILPGVTRDLVLRLAARAGLRTRETPLGVGCLRRADELFLTASTIEVLPVVRLDGHTVARGCPGPVTRALQARYREAVAHALA